MQPNVIRNMCCLSLFLVAGAPLVTNAADVQSQNTWSRWRGWNGAGQGGEASFPVEWTEKDWKWSAELPGVGHASPVVWDDHIYLASADESSQVRYLLSYDLKTGRELWRCEIPGPIERHHVQNSSASGSVAVDESGIYWLWGTRKNVRLEAVSHEGKRRWHMDLGPFVAQHGFCSTPSICEDTVIVPLEQAGPGCVIGIHKTTGQEQWRLPREGAEKAGYSTPLVLRSPENPRVICTSNVYGVYEIDPRTGKVLWENRCFPRRTVASPIEAAGLFIGTSGNGGGNNLLVAIRPPKRPDQKAEIAYQIDTSTAPYVPTPLESNGRLYLWGDRGVVTCVQAKDGNLLWKGRVGGNFSSSPIAIGERIINVSSDGEIVVIADSDTLEILGRTNLGEETRATPAVAGGHLVFRSGSHLWALKLSNP